MPSPFPGMDPYLEAPTEWPGVHTQMLVAFHDALNADLPRNYVARIDQYVWLDYGDDGDELLGRLDLLIPELKGRRGTERTRTAETTAASSVVTLPQPRRRKTRYLKVIDSHGGRVVTVLELLSPDNKSVGRGRRKYLCKRDGYKITDVNWVEIDLLRAGRRLDIGRPKPPAADYYILVSPIETAPKASVWTFTVRDPIPRIPIPLRPGEAAVALDIRAGLDRTYDSSRFAQVLDYSRPPVPALRKTDAVWAKELLKGKGIV